MSGVSRAASGDLLDVGGAVLLTAQDARSQRGGAQIPPEPLSAAASPYPRPRAAEPANTRPEREAVDSARIPSWLIVLGLFLVLGLLGGIEVPG